MSITLDNKVLAVVTGAFRGNGATIASSFERAGAQVVRVDLQRCGLGLDCFEGDVLDQKLIKQVVDYVNTQHYNSLVLVNNAGITLPCVYPYPQSYWDKTLAVNLTAPYQWIEAFVPMFKKAGNGSIINITSLGADRAFPNNPSYMASKGGLKMLTKYYAKSLGSYGIRANNVGPGYIVTDMTSESYLDKESKSLREHHTLLGHWGRPEDVAGVCLFLASDVANYVTGQDIYVDGGWTANGLVE